MFVSSWICAMVQPRSRARNSAHIRRSFGITSWRCSAVSCSSVSSFGWPNSDVRLPSSSERMPFRKACLKVRPMAIASPTDFICVVSVSSACGNFSNAQRGILTTT